MEKRFKTVVERIEKNREALDNKLCREYWLKLKRMQERCTDEDIWNILTENVAWVVNLGFMPTADFVKWFSEEELNAHGIYSKGTHKVAGGRHIGIKNAKLISGLHTEIILFDEAQAECYDTTFLTCFNSAKAEITDGIAWGLGNSEIVANGSRVELFDNAKAINKGNSLIVRG